MKTELKTWDEVENLRDLHTGPQSEITAERDRLKAALDEIAAIAAAGVIQRSETGKPMWTAFDSIKDIIAKAKGEA